jgi:probable F420-dependent oxidoreductase
MNLERLGVFAFMDGMRGGDSARFARLVEQLGYSVLWYPEWAGRDAFAHAPFLLSATTSLVIATGIANAFKRDAFAAASAAWTIGELFDGRFILGLGVGHRSSNLQLGRPYERPLSHMRAYLDALSEAPYTAPRPHGRVEVVIAALLPGMLRLAGAAADGILTYFAPPHHTRLARDIIGPDKKLCVTQALILEEDVNEGSKCSASFRQPFSQAAQLPAPCAAARVFGIRFRRRRQRTTS